MNQVVSRILFAAVAIIAYLNGVVADDVPITEVSLTAKQLFGLIGVVITAYMSPSQVGRAKESGKQFVKNISNKP